MREPRSPPKPGWHGRQSKRFSIHIDMDPVSQGNDGDNGTRIPKAKTTHQERVTHNNRWGCRSRTCGQLEERTKTTSILEFLERKIWWGDSPLVVTTSKLNFHVYVRGTSCCCSKMVDNRREVRYGETEDRSRGQCHRRGNAAWRIEVRGVAMQRGSRRKM